ncbi:MAG TPA: peptide ABC transporter substrate-binding protein, partial [Pyrinomonadaceae bacterium]
TVPGSEKQRKESLDGDPKLKAAVEGKELVPIRGEDIGVEAIDDWTFRLRLRQPAPYFIGLLGHQLFRIVHPPTVEKFGKAWTKPENIVTSGAFLLKEHRPYDRIVTVKNPNYWDAEMVRLAGIEFYPLDEATTMMNLYKAGSIDAMYNHTPPAAWNEVVREYKDEYLNFPEVAIEYYTINVKKPPMNNLKVRQAFSLAIDREALAKFRKTTKPLVDFTPEGIFPKYEEARKKVYAEELKKKGMTMEQWRARVFDPVKARQLLTEAGFPVQQSGNRYSVPNFPVEQVELLYNTAESNKASAEFIQAQWKQNLGITIPLKNMEWKTFLTYRKKLEYSGFGRAGWVGDYMDPFTFLYLFYSEKNDSSTGWFDPKYDKLLDEANMEEDEMKRFEKLALAEFMMIQEQPVIPLQTQATNWIKKPYVKGMYPNPGTLHAWKFVYLEQDPQKWDRDVDNIMNVSDTWVDGHISRIMATQLRLKEEMKGDDARTAE